MLSLRSLLRGHLTILSCFLWLAGLLNAMPVMAGSDIPTAPADEPTLFVADTLTGMTVAGDQVYWYANCGDSFYPSRSFLRSKASAGGTTETRYAPVTCTGGAVASFNVAVDDGFVYWLEADGRVVRQRANPVPPGVEVLARTAGSSVGGYPSCCNIAVDNTHLFWSERNRIFRIPKGGGTRHEIRSEPVGSFISALQAGGDGTLFYRVGGRLVVLRTTDGTTYSAHEIHSSIAAYTLSSTRVYYGVAAGRAYVIGSVRRSDLRDARFEYVSDTVGAPRLRNMTSDGTNLYWNDTRGSSAGGPIFRKPLDGGIGDAVQITGYRTDVSLLQAGGGRIFWTSYRGIFTLSAGSSTVPGPSGDLQITGVQITQGIQTDDHEVPLVGNKPTVVRVFARSVMDSNGPWTDVVARLQIEGSPVTYQSAALTIPPGGSDPNSLTDSFTFILRGRDTAPGTRNATISIGSRSGRPESTRANNTLSRTLIFGPAQRLTIYGMAHGNRNNGAHCVGAAPNDYVPPFSNFEAHRLYMENLYPLSQLTILPLPGNPRLTFDNSEEGCLAHEHAHIWMARALALLHPGGGKRGHLLTPESGGYYGWCCMHDGGNQVARGQDYRDDPGPIMSHEIGHSFDRDHTFEDPNYIRDGVGVPRGGSMGPFLGFRLLSNEPTPRPQVIRGETDDDNFFGDIMSYHWFFWISPYTYCALAASISGGIIRCPPGTDGLPVTTAAATAAESVAVTTNAANAGTYLYVSGYVDKSGKLTFQPFEQLQLEGKPAAPEGQGYTLRLVTANGAQGGGIYNFGVAPLKDDWPNNPQAPAQRFFGFYLPWDPAIVAISAYEGQQIPLAQRLVTPSSPQFISLTLDYDDQQVTGKRTLAWHATDADIQGPNQGSLTYSVWYSPNEGQRWLPVDVLVATNSTEVDFDALPGGNKAMIRVLASDGVNTASIATAPFVVPSHPPVVSASATVDSDGYLELARSSAFDWEEGAIEQTDAFVWSSNWQGEVGRGPWLSAADLEPGSHLLTIRVTDSEGKSSTATLDVHVRSVEELSAVVLNPTGAATATLPGLPNIQVTFPAGTVAEPVRVTVGEIFAPLLPIPLGMVGRLFAINASTAGGDPVTQFAAHFTVAVGYDEAQLEGAKEEQLALFFQDESTGNWQEVESVVDPARNSVTAKFDRHARFALVVTPTEPDLVSRVLYLPLLLR